MQHANLALNLDGCIWEVSSLATEHMQIHCLEETHLEFIMPTLMSIYISNGCEGYNTNIYIPSETDINSDIYTSIRCEFFVGIDAVYQNMAHFGIWYELKLDRPTQEQKDILDIKLSESPLGFKLFK